jgi:hypothetical protein
MCKEWCPRGQQGARGNIQASMGIELDYGTNKLACLRFWQPCYMKEDKEVPPFLEVKIVIDHIFSVRYTL